MLASQLRELPKDQQEKILAAVEGNPELFETIALEMQAKIKEGKGEMAAAMEVMQAHRNDIEQAMR